MATAPSAMGGMGAAPDDDSESEGVAVCITAMPDGTYTVAIQESGQEEQGETEDSGDGPKTAQNIDDALDMARQMLTQESSEEGSESEGDDNAPLSQPDAKKAWDQMAAQRSKRTPM